MQEPGVGAVKAYEGPRERLVERLSGARALRWIAPNAIVTMDYRTDRLNMHHDAANRITRINCG